MRARRGAGCGWGVTLVMMLTVAAFLSSPAEAQQPDTLTLTLEEALRIAEANNPAYRQAVNQLALNPTETRNTWLNTVLPETNLTLFNTAYSGNIRRRAIDEFGNPVARPEAEWQYFSNTQQALTLDWNVQGTNLLNALDRQRETNQGRDLAGEAALARARAAVRRSFYRAQEQEELLQMEVELEEQRRVELELAERLFSLAVRSRVDVLNAELGIQQQALAVRRQRAGRQQALLALRTVLGDQDLLAFHLAPEPIAVFDPSTLDLETLAAQAAGSNPGVLEAESGERLALLGVREEKNRWWPNLSFFYRVSRVAQTPEGEALFDVSPDEDLDHNFAINLSLPFFNNWFRSSADVQRAEVDWDNTRERVREARLRVEESVRSAVLDLENGYETLRLAERALEIAGEALGLAREEYRLGSRTFEQLRESVEQEAEARRLVIQARYLFVDALVTLEEAVGAPVRVPPVAEAVEAGAPGGR